MSIAKRIIIAVVFLMTGGGFAAAGIYFLSAKFTAKLAGYRDGGKRLSKACGYFSIGTGILTAFCGLLMALFPVTAMFIALFYLTVLLIGTIWLSVEIMPKK